MYTAESVGGLVGWLAGCSLVWAARLSATSLCISRMARPARGPPLPAAPTSQSRNPRTRNGRTPQRRTKTTSHRSSDLTTLSTGKFMQVVGTPIIQQHYCWRWFPLILDLHDISAPLSSPRSELGTVGINPSVLALRRFGPKVLVSASHGGPVPPTFSCCILLYPRSCSSYLISPLSATHGFLYRDSGTAQTKRRKTLVD